MTIRKIFPVTFTTTYGIPDIEVYLAECEADDIEPTQANFLAWAKADLRYLAENSALTECDFESRIIDTDSVNVILDGIEDEPAQEVKPNGSSWFSWLPWAKS